MYTRPDRPLIVKCTFDRWNKRITFSSAKNCTYDLLRHKVEQCFSLHATNYAIAYKDDDGEVTDITTDTDLTEAIQYFQAGSDDPPMSSAASILSGRSFGTRKITLRVHITVDYDGPSLSDTSSLISLEEYKNRNGSQISFSFGAPSVDLDDDSVTVSSRDTGAPSRSDGQSSRLSEVTHSEEDVPNGNLAHPPQRSSSLGHSVGAKGTSKSPEYSSEGQTQRGENPFADEFQLSAAHRYPEDPSAVFERLKLEEAVGDDSSIVEFDTLSGNDRGAAWLRDQNERTMRSMIGMLPEPSESDGASIDLGGDRLSSDMGGDLALRRDFRGKYYYSYTSVGSSGVSQSHNSVSEDNLGGPFEEELSTDGNMDRPRPTSRHLNWLAAQQIHPVPQPKHTNSDPSSQRSASYSPNSEPAPSRRYEGIPPEVLQYIIPTAPPPDELTDCSECGVLLDSMRYVCSTCGEKPPVSSREKGKGKNISYPPPRHRTSSSSPVHTSSSRTFFEGSDSGQPRRRYKPLPSIPSLPSLSQYQLAAPGPQAPEIGYELCSGCIQSAGVFHAIEAGLAPASSPGRENSSPSSPEDAQRALSQWRRSAPKHKGQLRHAYLEKVWGHTGWEDVEQEESRVSKCSTCTAINLRKRYKCASCAKFELCRACYSQVHDLHPNHAFFIVPDKPARSRSDPDILLPIMFADPNEEQSMKHPGVKCAHCMLDIVGARFHCAICDSVDICSNCESAGLPGNLDSFDDGHNSSHIMIKIPFPLETTELRGVSQRAANLWQGRDAATVERASSRSKPSSVVSSYARTVVGNGMGEDHPLKASANDHHMFCNGCSKPIVGIRYQCANCPSSPNSYNLCITCEARSYIVHDPMHAFFKLPRPVQRPLESLFPMLPKLYKTPAGPSPGTGNSSDPKAYLKTLVHSSAVCDRCMTCIQGEWFRCAYCAKDLCDACEELDTHNDSHVFLVFKSTVDMQVFKHFTDLENPNGSPPVIPYPVYR